MFRLVSDLLSLFSFSGRCLVIPNYDAHFDLPQAYHNFSMPVTVP